jgi:RND superfamily putative drug exporter
VDGAVGGLMARLARFCFTRRRAVLVVWLVALVGVGAVGAAAKATYTNSFSLPGADSTAAQQVLAANFPASSGDSEQVVVEARQGTLRTPAVRHLPHVRSVTSPYGATGQISRDGTIGFATVDLDAPAQDVPAAAVSRLISTARSADGSLLDVQVGGQAVESEEQQGGGSSDLLIGVVLALVVLFFAFRRSVLGALLPLVSALVGIGVATAIVDLLTHVMAIASWEPQVATLVALGVGVDYALFIVSRHRAGLLAGRTPEEAAVTALDTSGRAVLLAGSTVCVALLGMFALQVGFLYAVAVTVALAVVLTMLASLTLLPAMLGFFGPKVLRRAEREAGEQPVDGFWARWAAMVDRHAAVASLLALGVIVVLALPFLGLRQGLPDASTDPASTTSYQAYELLAKGFGPGFSGPLELVARVEGHADRARFAAFVASLEGQPGVAGVVPPRPSPNGRAEVAVLYPTTGPQDARTAALLSRVRAAVPRAEAGTTLTVHVGGDTAVDQDFTAVLSSKMPQFVAVVVGLGFLLLAVALRSLLVPLVASVMNLLSFGAALGVMTAAFQYGWGRPVLGFGQSGPIVSWLPLMMFAILFGLSMDYEVFLVSRMREEWLRSGDNERAVARGQAETGRVITAAALIMILVFASFMVGDQLALQQIGLGFAAAIFVDAFVVRTVLVPATMHVLGPANWWFPAWLDRSLPRLRMEPADVAGVQPAD